MWKFTLSLSRRKRENIEAAWLTPTEVMISKFQSLCTSWLLAALRHSWPRKRFVLHTLTWCSSGEIVLQECVAGGDVNRLLRIAASVAKDDSPPLCSITPLATKRSGQSRLCPSPCQPCQQNGVSFLLPARIRWSSVMPGRSWGETSMCRSVSWGSSKLCWKTWEIVSFCVSFI